MIQVRQATTRNIACADACICAIFVHLGVMSELPVWTGGPNLLEPSTWWWAMRTESHGEAMLRDILRQILLALETLHAANVTHR